MYLYRPPGLSIPTFLSEFAELLENVTSKSGNNFVICGDFNLPGQGTAVIDDRLASLLDGFNLEQTVISPTRNESLLDLMIQSVRSNLVARSTVIDQIGISDPRLVVSQLHIEQVQRNFSSFTHRNIKSLNISQFKHSILDSELFTSPATDCDGFVEQIQTFVTKILDKIALLQTR